MNGRVLKGLVIRRYPNLLKFSSLNLKFILGKVLGKYVNLGEGSKFFEKIK